MIDLHSHTTASDGTLSPVELVDAAVAAGLEALAITDHDTFAGYHEARPRAHERGLRLLCGIELSTEIFEPSRKTVHLLGYFLDGEAAPEFCSWISGLQAARRDRNRRLADKLQSLGMDVQPEEVEAIGRTMAGRPRFARILVQKGYCRNSREAFDRYLDESAQAYVDREEPPLFDAIARIRAAGGVSSLAHPIRIGRHSVDEEERLIGSLAAGGLQAIEAFHSDHGPEDTNRYIGLARKYGLKLTGGSDFHGDNKPNVTLGRGVGGSLNIPNSLLDELAH